MRLRTGVARHGRQGARDFVRRQLSGLNQADPAQDGVERCAQLVRQRGDEFVFDAAGLCMRGPLAHEAGAFLLSDLAVRDVADGADREHSFFCDERTEADLNGELGAVLSHAEQLESRPHWSRLCTDEVALALVAMRRAITLWEEHFDVAPMHFCGQVTKKSFGVTIDHLDDAPLVDDDHGFRGCFEESAEIRIRCDRESWRRHKARSLIANTRARQ